jgi:hypothetical protein
MIMSRRFMLQAGVILCGCAPCSLVTPGTVGLARADAPTRIQGRGFELHFIGAQRETVMHGKLAAAIDLRSLANTPHLYAIGPIEQLRGEVTIAPVARASKGLNRSEGVWKSRSPHPGPISCE